MSVGHLVYPGVCNSNDKKKAPARKAPPAVPTTPSNVWNPSIHIFSKHFMPRWSLQLHLSAEIERFFYQTRGFSNGIPLWNQVQIRSQRLFYLKNRVWRSSTLIESFSVLSWSSLAPLSSLPRCTKWAKFQFVRCPESRWDRETCFSQFSHD